jgi:uncharacterized membrane protein YkoI
MRNRNLVIVAILSIIASTITGILVSTYAQQVNAQNQTGSTSSSSITSTSSIKNNPSAGAANSDWTGSIRLSSTLSQTIESKVHTSLSNAITVAEKTVGANSYATSGRLTAENGFLVYSVWVRNPTNNSLHRIIVDAGNGKVLVNQQPSLMGYYHHGFGSGGIGRHLGFMGSHNRGMFMHQNLDDYQGALVNQGLI